MRDIRMLPIAENEIETVLAEDIDFEGELSFEKPLMIKGRFKGEIKSTSDLYVGEKAVVEAKIEANKISTKGRIKGDILAHNRIELANTASVDGDLVTPDLVIESGCIFNGLCAMNDSRPVAARKAVQP